jgi:hypothetical protein
MTGLELKEIHYVETGGLTVDRIIYNEETLRDAINDGDVSIAELMAFVNRYLGFGSCSFAVDEIGRHTAISGDKHPDMKLTHAYAVIGSNVQLRTGNKEYLDNTTIEILQNGSELLADPIRFVASETKGKIRVGVVMDHIDIMRSDSVEIETDTNQTVAVHMNFEPQAVA